MTNISDVNSGIDSEGAGGSHVKVKNKLPLVNSTSSSKIESVLKKKKFVNRRKKNNMKKRKSSPSPEIMTNGHSPSSEEKKHDENGRYLMRTRTRHFVPDMIPSHLLLSSSEDTDICESDELHIVENEEEIAHIKSKLNPENKPMSLKQKVSCKKLTSKKRSKASKLDHSSESQDSAEETDDCKECPICGTTLADKHSFTLHIREHNTDKQSRVCQICSKKLSSPSSLDRHMYVHSGERPFKCSLCHLSFTTNGNMHRHMRTHGSRLGQVKELDDHLTDEDKMDQFAVKHKRPNLELSMKEESNGEDVTVKKIKLETPVKSFKCHVCSKVCASLALFRSHMEIHPDDPIKCHKCNVVCKSYSCYETHSCVRSAPSETEERVVGFCDLNFVAFSSKNFPLIAKRECEEKCRSPSSALLAFECRTCGKAFPSKQTVRQHENVHESNAGTYCHTCECVFETEKQFQSHQLTHRSVEINKSCSDTKCLDTKQDFLAVLGLRCVEFFNKSDLFVNSNENCCKIKKEEDLFTDIKVIGQTDTSNDFADIPSIISLTSKAQIPDIRSSPVAAEPASPQDFNLDHAPISPVVEGSANASLHLSSEGVPTEPKEASSGIQNGDSDQTLSCKKCSQVFSTEKELRYHARSHSQSGQPHKCSFCSYQSVDKSTLMRHMRTHNGERPFKCSICDYAFTTKANSHRHVKKKHKLPDYKVADAIVYNPNMLESNIVETFTSDMNGNETVCKYCNTDFKYNRVLRHHLRSMNNSCRKKPFSCRNCKLGFSTKNNCIRHINQQHPHLKDSLKDLIVVNTPQKMDQDHNSDSASSSNIIDEPQGDLVIDDAWEGDDNQSEHPESEPSSETDKISSNEQLENQLNNLSEDDRVSIAQSLVSLSEGVPPQMAPLDLSVRALDLTAPLDFTVSSANYSGLKSDEMGLDLTVYSGSSRNSEVLAPQPAHSSPVITKIFEPEPLTNNALSPINLIQKDAAHMTNYQISPINPVIPMICLSQSCPTPPVINTSLTNQIFVPNVICLPIPSESTSLPSQQIVKEKLSTAQKTCQCDYCDAQFTLKSNKERHIKKKHPEHARPTRSRNFISVLPSTDAQKQTISTLSDKTRHALRTVLNTKVNNVKLETGAEECESHLNISEGKIDSFMENGHIPESIDKHSEDAKSDSENIDLASVSSLINTANSQAIKHIMRDAKNCDMNSQLLQICDNAHSSSDTDSGSSSDSKKKSSYSKCKNHIKCGICPHTFPWHSSLKRHERTHTGDKPFKCFFCPVQFTTKSNRDRHVGRKHKSNDESIRKHGQEGLYRCDTCPNSSFHSPEELKKHINLHHTLSEERPKQFVAHNGSAENVSNIKFSPTKPANCNTVTDITENSFECRFCKTMYKTETDRVNHIKELHPLEYSALLGKEDGFPYARLLPWKKNGLVKGKDEAVDENACQDEIFTCFFCLQFLKTKDLLFEHVNKHSEDVPCVCKLCKSTFHTTQDMNIWEHQLEHMKEKPFEKAAEKIISLCNNSGKKKSNSFLNSFLPRDKTPKPAHANSAAATVEHSAEATDVPSDGNLIVNLLGGEDPKVIDEMIDCAVRSRMESKA